MSDLRDLRPMLAVPGPVLPPGPGWAFEVKWDGVRALVHREVGLTTVFTRTGREVGSTFPEVVARLGDRPMVVDGEIVALDATGAPSFGRLQRRMHVTSPSAVAALVEEVPVALLAFDLLALDGRDLTGLPYDERRGLLVGLAPALAVPASFPDGPALFAATGAQGLEGVVAKRCSSPYQPGRRSPDWVKVKHLRTQEVVIGGWAPGAGRRAGGIGALLLGLPDDARSGLLRYIGNVGTGFTDRALTALAGALHDLSSDSCPFLEVPRLQARTARWARPVLVGEVAFAEWTVEARLRHPRWRGLRPDKAPGDVVRD